MLQASGIDSLNKRLAFAASVGTILDKLSTAICLSMPDTKETNGLANIFFRVFGVPFGCFALSIASVVLILGICRLAKSVPKAYCKITGTMVLVALALVFAACFINNTRILIG